MQHKTMVEFGSFVGYTATRMGRAVELCYEKGYADGSILFEDSRLQGANRITSMEIDPVHACIARHVLDMSRLSHIVEVPDAASSSSGSEVPPSDVGQLRWSF
eukprot:g22907.t1